MGAEREPIENGENVNFEEAPIEQTVVEQLFVIDSMMRAQRGEARPLAHVEDGLNRKIIGQAEAIESLVIALNREKLRNPKRPLANLLFLGPTGVGKTETAKVLDQLLHDGEDTLIKINCSEIAENHRVSALIGAAPEYVGREQKPLLDKKKIERPRSIVLFDEIEKGAPKLHDLLLQILEDGEVTILNSGQKVSFKNSIIIMTSNIGSKDIQDKLRSGGLGFRSTGATASKKEIDDAVMGALKRANLRPELLNRIDRKITFMPLNDTQLAEILDRHVDESNEFYEKEGYRLVLTPEVRDELIKTCDERKDFGARPVLRRYEQWVEALLAEYVNSDGIPRGSKVFTFIDDDAPKDAPLNERIDLQYMRDVSLLKKPQKALPKGKSAGAENEEQQASTDPLFKHRFALGAAAALGLGAMFAADYLSSRRYA